MRSWGAKVIDVETGAGVDDLRSVSYRHDAGELPVLVVEILITDGEAFVTGPETIKLSGPQVAPGMVVERHRG